MSGTRDTAQVSAGKNFRKPLRTTTASLFITEPPVPRVPHENVHNTKSLSFTHQPRTGSTATKKSYRQDLTGTQNRFPSLRGLKTTLTDFPLEAQVFMDVFNYFDSAGGA